MTIFFKGQSINCNHLLHPSSISIFNIIKLDINSLTPGRYCHIFKQVTFQHFVVSDIKNSFYEIVSSLMPMVWLNDQSTLVQVMAWCRQAPSHYLSQCWPRSLSPYGITRPQWVKLIGPVRCGSNFQKYKFQTQHKAITWTSHHETCSVALTSEQFHTKWRELNLQQVFRD